MPVQLINDLSFQPRKKGAGMMLTVEMERTILKSIV